MRWIYNDGGRSKYFKGEVRDCVTRAIAIATGKDYLEVYNEINALAKKEHNSKYYTKSNARNGVRKATDRKYLESLGWKWISTCKPGEGVSMHFVEDEIPDGTVILQISKHLVCVKDKVIHDTYNSSEKKYFDRQYGDYLVNDRRAVYGYYVKVN